MFALCIYGVRSGFPNGTNDIPISFNVLPMVPLGEPEQGHRLWDRINEAVLIGSYNLCFEQN